MSGPLSGFRILDLSSVLSGPVATRMLADQGADVIKVEPLYGDIVRQMGVGGDGITPGFLSINRGKRSIAVDLKTAEGLVIVKRIAATVDVFVQNFRPGAIERMGLGEEVVRAIKPDILYVSISGFGEDGPYAHKRVYDPVIQALSGIADIQADSDGGRPRMMRTLIPDKTTALTGAQAITAGLLARERTGEGQHIKLAMLDAVISFLWPEGLLGLTVVGEEAVVGSGQIAQDLVFKTTDGYITAGAISDNEWHGMCTALERPEWLDDERFKTTTGRIVHAKERIAMTAEVLVTKSSAEWLALLDEHGVPCAPVLTRAQVLEHEQVKANELISEYEQPGLGAIRQPRNAARFGGTPTRKDPIAPKLGEHNREVLSEVGYTDPEIDGFQQAGVLGGGG
jgi:crotonobetainyl-CoA:carnitine CoA-transferase CaiB-like acyl-CoA transferase